MWFTFGMTTTTATLKNTKTNNVTYLGRRAKVTDYRYGGPASPRLVLIEWVDDADPKNGGHKAGTVVARVLTGPVRNPQVLVAPRTFKSVSAAVAALLPTVKGATKH
jgi:hypothetical protein